MPILSGLFGDRGLAVVIGLPERFVLRQALADKTQIYLAVAFATESGWRLLGPSLLANRNAKLKLIAGQNGCITQPKLLEAWISPELSERNVEAYLHSPSPFFHPKILLALDDNQRGFAIVGSGNLTAGGLEKNIECGAYINDTGVLADLRVWLDGVIEDGGEQIDQNLIQKYKILVDEMAKARRNAAREAQVRVALRLRAPSIEVTPARRQAFVDDAREYFRHPPVGYRTRVRQQNEMARDITIRLALNGRCNVSRHGWAVMYEHGELGNIKSLHREKILNDISVLRRGLRILCNDARGVAVRLNDVLSNKSPARVPGWGANIATKILCVRHPDLYPVWNSAAIAALESYGFRFSGLGNKGEFYSCYVSTIREIADEIGVSPMRLDLFLFTVFDEGRAN